MHNNKIEKKNKNLKVTHQIKEQINHFSKVKLKNEHCKYVPSAGDRDNTSSVLSNVLKDWLRKIKVILRRVAPSFNIVWEGIIWWAEISGCDHNGARKTPFWVIHTLNLITRTTP